MVQLASIWWFSSILKQREKEVEVQAGCIDFEVPMFSCGWVAFPGAPFQAKLPLGIHHSKCERVPTKAKGCTFGKSCSYPPFPSPSFCNPLGCSHAENGTQPQFHVELAWYSGSTYFLRAKKKFCDCCVAWLPSVRSSQCSSPGELDQRMKNVLWWLRIGSWVGTWWQEGQSSHHSPPDSCGQHRCQQRASLLVSQTRGWFRPTLFYRNIEEGCNYWEVGDSASLQDQKAVQPCDAHREHMRCSPWWSCWGCEVTEVTGSSLRPDQCTRVLYRNYSLLNSFLEAGEGGKLRVWD